MRAERLRLTKDIDLVRAAGERRSDRHFSVRARPNGVGTVRIAAASSRALGGAVKRNRARRRLREAIRSHLQGRMSAPGTDLLVVARPAALRAPTTHLREAVAREIDGLLGRGTP